MASRERGRTLWEILVTKNKRDITPLELQYHNPLKVRVGNTVSLDHEVGLRGINFVIERISVYETKVRERKFYHTDYHLKALTLEAERPLRFRLRLIPDEDETNKLGCKVQLLQVYHQMEWDEDFYKEVLLSDSGHFLIHEDDEGNRLDTPRRYWRLEGVLDAYRARVTVLSDKDGDGKIDDEELERLDVTYWDYHRETINEYGQNFVEFLTVEMNERSRYFTMLRGNEVLGSQIFVI